MSDRLADAMIYALCSRPVQTAVIAAAATTVAATFLVIRGRAA